MNNKLKDKKWIGAGLFAAIVASLCCITPVLAVLGGLGGIASTFSFLEPLRPYLIGVTVLVLGFAFYKAYKPKKKEEIDCACEPARLAGGEDEKKSFLNSKAFLWVVAGVSILMFSFPSYSHVFFPETNKVAIVNESNIAEITLQIEGMTCTGCEESVDYALKTENGVVSVTSSYKTGIAKVKFDKTKVKPEQLKKAVEEKVGYNVKNYKVK
ncbi:MAG: mercuric transport protein MerTP [Ignavibacteriae bacterium]|nr:mercuric transport protein MerTP [Ignavibacteriota bacterium]NOG99778.1 mercuric transport protein MerTP [Ignavibacteriota bacterium]